MQITYKNLFVHCIFTNILLTLQKIYINKILTFFILAVLKKVVILYIGLKTPIKYYGLTKQ